MTVLTSSGLNPNGGSARNLAKSNSDVDEAPPFAFPFALACASELPGWGEDAEEGRGGRDALNEDGVAPTREGKSSVPPKY